jgi:hypothetical protein
MLTNLEKSSFWKLFRYWSYSVNMQREVQQCHNSINRINNISTLHHKALQMFQLLVVDAWNLWMMGVEEVPRHNGVNSHRWGHNFMNGVWNVKIALFQLFSVNRFDLSMHRTYKKFYNLALIMLTSKQLHLWPPSYLKFRYLIYSNYRHG